MAASYSDAPLSTIDVGALTASRFLLREQRLFPYRDGEGRVALSLVRDSLARLSETDSAVLAGSGTTFAELSAKLSRLERLPPAVLRELQAPAVAVSPDGARPPHWIRDSGGYGGDAGAVFADGSVAPSRKKKRTRQRPWSCGSCEGCLLLEDCGTCAGCVFNDRAAREEEGRCRCVACGATRTPKWRGDGGKPRVERWC
ncbi:hypothetical protein EMIHUDRAFT_206121 [Emiliania huxleyi CCMP1516]|uniref:4Fe-4S ferredoxin-type domain-containing protein n=2 Tax=Emiliania huxleyi TaxID=2903 RepID=A0A0D3JNH2_EMIH1|nr:hypothetical protein EMIHUDRAFT_206121 [Emiliania huxleyi CCMP1516]EOD25057.1 hypothetical protein EMIHUDRAFT_206121 [Emiliania huxleyi CCMP1516]|eukprot:XP_005777486.1 hypothetical protein EMIHUDRAFT_206121 [Emiliania huxleyi CCMP1516]